MKWKVILRVRERLKGREEIVSCVYAGNSEFNVTEVGNNYTVNFDKKYCDYNE